MGNSYSPPLSHCSCTCLAVGFLLPPRKKKAAPREKVTIATALTRATPQSIRLSDVSRLAISTGGINLRVWEDVGSGPKKKKSFHVDDLVEELLPHGKQTFFLFKRAENKQISILTTFKNFSLSSVWCTWSIQGRQGLNTQMYKHCCTNIYIFCRSTAKWPSPPRDHMASSSSSFYSSSLSLPSLPLTCRCQRSNRIFPHNRKGPSLQRSARHRGFTELHCCACRPSVVSHSPGAINSSTLPGSLNSSSSALSCKLEPHHAPLAPLLSRQGNRERS